MEPLQNSAVSHLAILVVYHLRDDAELPVLQLHLAQIARHTRVPYTIYAVTNRISDTAKAILRAEANVIVCPSPPTEYRGSKEHGHYLDTLLPIALANQASHICTLDVDSFPCSDNWIETITQLPSTPSGMAAVLRRENGDTDLPHPSCILATRQFFERFQPSFAPMLTRTPQHRRFLRVTSQKPDTGIALAAALWESGLKWAPLERSNERNPHYLIAGIYADVIFHLGGVASGQLFRNDMNQSLVHRISRPIELIPEFHPFLTRSKRRMFHSVRAKAETRLTARNREVYTILRDWLIEDPESLFAYLRGLPTEPNHSIDSLIALDRHQIDDEPRT